MPHLINAEPPRPRIEATRIVDMRSKSGAVSFDVLETEAAHAALQ
jgi:hypothetical protein